MNITACEWRLSPRCYSTANFTRRNERDGIYSARFDAHRQCKTLDYWTDRVSPHARCRKG